MISFRFLGSCKELRWAEPCKSLLQKKNGLSGRIVRSTKRHYEYSSTTHKLLSDMLTNSFPSKSLKPHRWTCDLNFAMQNNFWRHTGDDVLSTVYSELVWLVDRRRIRLNFMVIAPCIRPRILNGLPSFVRLNGLPSLPLTPMSPAMAWSSSESFPHGRLASKMFSVCVAIEWPVQAVNQRAAGQVSESPSRRTLADHGAEEFKPKSTALQAVSNGSWKATCQWAHEDVHRQTCGGASQMWADQM